MTKASQNAMMALLGPNVNTKECATFAGIVTFKIQKPSLHFVNIKFRSHHALRAKAIVLYARMRDSRHNAKNVVVQVFVNMAKYELCVKTAGEVAFAHIKDRKQNARNAWVLAFANTATESLYAKSVEGLAFVSTGG
jgi:hypothetical protein